MASVGIVICMQLSSNACRHSNDILHNAAQCLPILAGMDNVRNMTGSPIAGIDPHEFIDSRILCKGMRLPRTCSSTTTLFAEEQSFRSLLLSKHGKLLSVCAVRSTRLRTCLHVPTGSRSLGRDRSTLTLHCTPTRMLSVLPFSALHGMSEQANQSEVDQHTRNCLALAALAAKLIATAVYEHDEEDANSPFLALQPLTI